MVKELTIVSSTVLIPAWSISRERSSRAETILVACPCNRGEIVLRRRLEPENFTSTSAIGDFEFATSSLTISEFEEELELGEGSSIIEEDGCK